MREIEIYKVKLKGGGDDGVDIRYHETGLIDSNIPRECENPVHEDFKNAVQGLAVHLAILTDFLPIKKSGDAGAIAMFTVTGYSVKGEDGNRGFVITGYLSTKRGGTVILNSPFTRFEEDEATVYSLVGDVESKISSIEEESKQYLFKGKQAPKKQLSLDMPGDEKVTNIKMDKPLKDGNEIVDDDDDFDLDELIQEEYVDPYKSGIGMKIPPADPDAMKRVAEMDDEEVNAGGNGKRKRGAGSKKK